MTPICAPADLSNVAAFMGAIDCQTTAYVESAYHGLFGDAGVLSAALTGALTIYVALYGYRLLLGGQGVAAPDLVKRFVAMGFILALSTNWPAYQTLFVSSVTGGADEVAGMMSAATGGRGETAQTVALRLDETLGAMTDLADAWSRNTPLDPVSAQTAAPGQDPAVIPSLSAPTRSAPMSAVSMLWISATLLGVGSIGVIVTTKILLAFLLALGPVFLTLALFSGTRGLFEGWLRAIVGAALVLALSLLATAAALTMIDPMVQAIADEQALGVNNPRSAFALTIACIIFALLIRQIVSAATRLTAAWRLPAMAANAAASIAAGEGAATKQAGPGDPRVLDLVAAVSRPEAHISASRATIAPTPLVVEVPTSDREGGGRRAARAYRGFGSSGLRAAGGVR